MKKLFTLSIILVGMVAQAFAGDAVLSVTAISNRNIYVLINGNQHRMNNNTLYLDDLNEGNYRIEVYQLGRGVRNNPFNRNQLLYNGNIYLRRNMHTDIVINRFGRAWVDQSNVNDSNNDRNGNDNGWNNGGWNNGNGGWNNGNGNGGWNNGNNGGWNNGNWNNTQAMSTTAFEQFKQTLCNQAFESNRLTMAKQVINSNWFTTDQVRDLMKQFNFENNKLDLAKHAYQFTIDRNNYFVLTNELAFDINKEALMRHIQGR